jgi:hypothetical protein
MIAGEALKPGRDIATWDIAVYFFDPRPALWNVLLAVIRR